MSSRTWYRLTESARCLLQAGFASDLMLLKELLAVLQLYRGSRLSTPSAWVRGRGASAQDEVEGRRSDVTYLNHEGKGVGGPPHAIDDHASDLTSNDVVGDSVANGRLVISTAGWEEAEEVMVDAV